MNDTDPKTLPDLERIKQAIADDFDEELEMQLEDERLDELVAEGMGGAGETLDRKVYFRELFRLQHELVRLQDWVAYKKLKMVVLFEGRDSAGKGGAIKRVTQRLNPRVARVVALPAPTERERHQWYFQRYVPHLPTAGEIVLFDRSWYNRAGVERVMGFCTRDELGEFFRSVPEFERMLVRSGIILVKYWFSITDEEQEFRFKMRMHDPLKQWKLSPMDLESRVHWEDYTRAKEEMFHRTHTGGGAVVGGAGGGQEAGAAKHDRAPAQPGGLRRRPEAGRRTAGAGPACRLRAPSRAARAVRAGRVLRAVDEAGARQAGACPVGRLSIPAGAIRPSA
nr:polyphosphate kinase 2 [Devosia sp.]